MIKTHHLIISFGFFSPVVICSLEQHFPLCFLVSYLYSSIVTGLEQLFWQSTIILSKVSSFFIVLSTYHKASQIVRHVFFVIKPNLKILFLLLCPYFCLLHGKHFGSWAIQSLLLNINIVFKEIYCTCNIIEVLQQLQRHNC